MISTLQGSPYCPTPPRLLALGPHTANSVKQQVLCPLPTVVPKRQTLALTASLGSLHFLDPSHSVPTRCFTLSPLAQTGPPSWPQPSPVHEGQDVEHGGHVRMTVA